MQTTVNKLREIRLMDMDETNEFLQTSLWGAFKAQTGWKPRAFAFSYLVGNQELTAKFLILSRKVFGPFFLAYIPFGPRVSLPAKEAGPLLHDLSKKLKNLLEKPLLAVRWDLPNHSETILQKLPGLKRGAVVQPPDTVWIDISQTEDALLDQMDRGHRYNVKYAERKGVVITEAGAEGVSRWFDIFRDTASRDGFAGHGEEYYQKLMDLSRDYKGPGKIFCRILFAEHEGDTLAGTILSIANGTATYLYSASSNTKRNLKPVYWMLWRAMQIAKAEGCHQFDMFGIPPDNNPNHHLAGLYDFKRNFGGKIVHRWGSWDAPSHFLYPVFKFAESLRAPKPKKSKVKHTESL